MRRLLAVALLVALARIAEAQTPAQMAEAQREFEAGQAAYNLTRYDESLVHYTKAYQLSRLAPILFNMGQSHRKLYEQQSDIKDLRQARELYRSYLRLVPISAERPLAETLLKEVEDEYGKQLHLQRDKLLSEPRGAAALNLANDFLQQGDLEATEIALERFTRTPGNRREDVASGERVRARIKAARGDEAAAVQSWSRALELDPSVVPPPDAERVALATYGRAKEAMKGKRPLQLSHVPPGRFRVGVRPRLKVETLSDPMNMVRHVKVSYRTGGGAFATLTTPPGEFGFPATFNASLGPGSRVEYYAVAVDDDGAILDTLGSDKLPFAFKIDAKPYWKTWPFWVGMGAGVLVLGGAAVAIGVTQAPPDRVAIPVNPGLLVR